MKREEATQLSQFDGKDVAELAESVEEVALAEPVSEDLTSFTVHLLAVVRIKFAGILATSAKEAADQAMERFDWNTHGWTAEFADDFTGALVDFDGDDDYEHSVEFDCELKEVKR